MTEFILCVSFLVKTMLHLVLFTAFSQKVSFLKERETVFFYRNRWRIDVLSYFQQCEAHNSIHINSYDIVNSLFIWSMEELTNTFPAGQKISSCLAYIFVRNFLYLSFRSHPRESNMNPFMIVISYPNHACNTDMSNLAFFDMAFLIFF